MVGYVRKRLFLQVSEAQSTGLRRCRSPPETAARWYYGPLIKDLTEHYNSQFCVSLIFIDWEVTRRL